jgi:hypothetical protein
MTILMLIVAVLLVEKMFFYFVIQRSSPTNLGYFGQFHRGLCLITNRAQLMGAACWGDRDGVCENESEAEPNEASPPPPYFVSAVPFCFFLLPTNHIIQQSMSINDVMTIRNEKSASFV